VATDLIPQYFLTKSALDLCGGPGETRGVPPGRVREVRDPPRPHAHLWGLASPLHIRTNPDLRTGQFANLHPHSNKHPSKKFGSKNFGALEASDNDLTLIESV